MWDRIFQSSVTGSEVRSCTWSNEHLESCDCACARLHTDQGNLRRGQPVTVQDSGGPRPQVLHAAAVRSSVFKKQCLQTAGGRPRPTAAGKTLSTRSTLSLLELSFASATARPRRTSASGTHNPALPISMPIPWPIRSRRPLHRPCLRPQHVGTPILPFQRERRARARTPPLLSSPRHPPGYKARRQTRATGACRQPAASSSPSASAPLMHLAQQLSSSAAQQLSSSRELGRDARAEGRELAIRQREALERRRQLEVLGRLGRARHRPRA